VGVSYLQGGSLHQAEARREVIVCNGAIASPQLLQRSGVGNADQLRQHGINSVVHLPGWARTCKTIWKCICNTTAPRCRFTRRCSGGTSRPSAWSGILNGTGLGATNHFEAGGFIRSSTEFAWPNLQYHFIPLAMNYDGSNPVKAHGFQCHVGSMRSPSTGFVRLASRDPRVKPLLQFNYMAHAVDWQELPGVRLTRSSPSRRLMKVARKSSRA
jgi:choline dehydrogenase